MYGSICLAGFHQTVWVSNWLEWDRKVWWTYFLHNRPQCKVADRYLEVLQKEAIDDGLIQSDFIHKFPYFFT